MVKKQEIKKITAGLVFGYIFGMIFGMSALGQFMNYNIFQGIILLIMAFVIWPPINVYLKQKYKFELSTGLKIVIIIIGFFSIMFFPGSFDEASTTSQTNNNEDNSYYIGDRVIIDDFAYTLEGYTITDKIGDYIFDTFNGETADGVFIVLDVTIENIGKESETLWDVPITIMDNQGRTYKRDNSAEFYLEDSFNFNQINPGLPKSGKIVFDVPEDIKGGFLIKSNNLFSDDYVVVQTTKKP